MVFIVPLFVCVLQEVISSEDYTSNAPIMSFTELNP